MTPAEQYLQKSRGLIDAVAAQLPQIQQAADWFAGTILAGRMVHVFASGHSRIMLEEMWPRYGSFPGFNPIVELSLTFHNLVVGANGQRQAMFLENVSGLAERILRNFALSPIDTALVISSSGCNIVPIEMAELFRKSGIKVVAIISKAHSEKSQSNHPQGCKLQDFADLVLDTGAPPGDAMVKIEGLETPVAPGSTIGGCLLINCIKSELAERLTKAGKPPTVLSGAALIGQKRAKELFEAAYDEHARRLSSLYQEIGTTVRRNRLSSGNFWYNSRMVMDTDIWDRIINSEQGDLSPEAARYFLSLSFPSTDKQRYSELVTKEPSELSWKEERELQQFVHANTVLMLLQAKARRSLAERQPAA